MFHIDDRSSKRVILFKLHNRPSLSTQNVNADSHSGSERLRWQLRRVTFAPHSSRFHKTRPGQQKPIIKLSISKRKDDRPSGLDRRRGENNLGTHRLPQCDKWEDRYRIRVYICNIHASPTHVLDATLYPRNRATIDTGR